MPKLNTLLKSLSSLFRSTKSTPATTTTSAAAKTSPAVDKSLKHFVSTLDASSASIPKRTLVKSHKRPQPSKPPSHAHLSSLVSISVDTSSFSDSEDPTRGYTSSILSGGFSVDLLDLEGDNGGKPSEDALEVPWVPDLSKCCVSIEQKEVSRERKQKWVHRKGGQVNNVNRIVDSCAVTLGTDAALNVLGILGRETGKKEFNALLKKCIEKASTTYDETVALEQVSKAFEFLMSMKEQGFPIEEESYGQVLLYLIDRGMVEKFHLFTDVIKDGSASTLARLGYYEMLLYTRVNDEEKVQEFCNCIFTSDGDETISLRENYLLALCDSDQKDYLLQLLETVDIMQISSLDHKAKASIFQSLGRLSLESHAEKFLLALKECDVEPEDISDLIFSYATSIPNLMVEDVLLRFKNLHTGIEMTPSSTSSSTLYAKLVKYSCDLLKVHVAFDLVDQMCKAGLSFSIDIIHPLLNAIEESSEFKLVQPIYSLICHYALKPKDETFNQLISLSVKMKDFDGAYGMLNDLKKLNLTPTESMYNAIIGGYFREKNVSGVSKVLKQMKLANVKPDSITYGYLIANCNSEEKVTEYYEELKASGVKVTKQIFMALINGFASCGQFEKAKQVLEEIPVKYLEEMRSVLVSALASHGEMADALDIYDDEIKKAGHKLKPRAVICLIEHLQCKGELSRVLELLEELHDSQYFKDGCNRAIQYCIHNKHLRQAVDLLKRLKDRFCDNELTMDTLFDEVFSIIPDTEPINLQIGLDLLQAIKDEIGVTPSSKNLDFLLSACVKAKDLHNSLSIWNEYKVAGLPYNVASYLRMYEALLASQGFASAKVLLKTIPKDDPCVHMVIEACQKTYIWTNSVKHKKRTKHKRNEYREEAELE